MYSDLWRRLLKGSPFFAVDLKGTALWEGEKGALEVRDKPFLKVPNFVRTRSRSFSVDPTGAFDLSFGRNPVTPVAFVGRGSSYFSSKGKHWPTSLAPGI